MYKLENNVEWTDELKNAFKHGITKGKITYENNTIDYDNGLKSFKLYDEKNVPSQGFIGQATARQVDIELIKEENFENKEVEVFLGADYNNQTYYINYGKFIVNQAPENDTTNGTIKITAFDYMIKFNKPYIPNVTFPCTMKAILDDVCNQCDVELATQEFANMNFMVDSNQFDGKECRDVLRHIAKSAFSWARIGQDNKLHLDFVVSNIITETIAINDYYQDKYKRANEIYGPINRVVYAESNIQGQEEKVEDTDSIALNGLHELVIYDNYFAYTTAFRQELIQAGTRLFGLEYMPIQELQMTGLVYLDCTDRVKIIESDDTEIITIPFNHIIEYNGAVSDTLTAEANSSNEETYKNTNSPINANSLTEIIVDRAMREIKAIVDYYVNFLHNKTGNNNIFISGTRTGEGFITKFIVKGNTEYFTTNDIAIIASEEIKNQETVLITEDGDTILTENEDTILLENKSLYVARKNIILDEPLRNLIVDGTNYYDELQILQDGTIQIVRRIGVSASQILYLLDEEKITILDDKFVLPSNEDGLYYFVEEIDNLDYYAEYIIKNEYSDMFATEAYVNAGLNLKVDTDKLVSELNASADTIRLIGQRLIIQMQNFSLDETGYMKAIAGQIAGFNMDENGFYKEFDTKYKYTMEDINLLLLYLNTGGQYENDMVMSSGLNNLFNVNEDENLNILDVLLMIQIMNGRIESPKNINGKIIINSDNINSLISITNNFGIEPARLGIYSLFYYLLSCKKIICGEVYKTSGQYNIKGVLIDGESEQIIVSSGEADTTKETIIKPTEVITKTLTQTSLESEKKNFEKLDNALEEVLNTDIYQYNFKYEEDDKKKHVGFVIGDNFNYSHLITTVNENGNEIGVDTYSMVSVLWKAVQEQQGQIEELKKEIKILKGEE